MNKKLNKLNKVRPGHGVSEWAGTTSHVGAAKEIAEARSTDLGALPLRRWDDELHLTNKVNIDEEADANIMFPSMHDITPGYLEYYVRTLRNLLEANNQIVMVTKPHLQCVERICAEFSEYRDWLLFRMTITSLNDDLSRYWEPGAPLPGERVEALQYAYESGFQTSVSVEPMLDTVESMVTLYHSLTPYITEDIWFGKMNAIDKRVDQNNNESVSAARTIKESQSDANILWLYDQLKDQPKVMWKDSIKTILSRRGVV